MLVLDDGDVYHRHYSCEAVGYHFHLYRRWLSTCWKRLQELEQARKERCWIGTTHVGLLKHEGRVAHQIIGFAVKGLLPLTQAVKLLEHKRFLGFLGSDGGEEGDAYFCRGF